jgi:poly-gamma-glutamate capsule biosynthesis protein CapA/YwtB (metallophosphatase superfamily)
MDDIADTEELVTLALCGDVMTGRGVDQILLHPSDPRLHESYLGSALDYVALAEEASGAIPRRVQPSYIWGDALDEIRNTRPDAFIVNLETAITRSEEFEAKGINYRMNPANAECLTAGGVDCCALANNHILDWGAAGLDETLHVLSENGVKAAGAGLTRAEASAPATIDLGAKGRVLIFALCLPTSGVPAKWAAETNRPGVNFLPDLSAQSLASIADKVRDFKKPADVAAASIHWGGNWGYDISAAQRRFAHALIEEAQIDIVHGHSSHHPKAVEIYQDRPILYGCGDFINDYEGIIGYEDYRDDLVLLHLVTLVRKTRRLEKLELAPFQIRKFRLNRPSEQDMTWLIERLRHEYSRFNVELTRTESGRFAVRWR